MLPKKSTKTPVFFVWEKRTDETRVEMEKNLLNLDTAALKALYEKHLQELSAALLSGVDWRDTGVQDKRKLLTELSKLLDKRSTNNPAEYANRS